jgi:hypothetical protein
MSAFYCSILWIVFIIVGGIGSGRSAAKIPNQNQLFYISHTTVHLKLHNKLYYCLQLKNDVHKYSKV